MIIRLTIFALFLTLFSMPAHSDDAEEFKQKHIENVRMIIASAMKDSSAWESLAFMCDTYGPRFSGTKNLENALAWMKRSMEKDGLDNVRAEDVMIPVWVRGNEYCTMLEPRVAKLEMTGLGRSIGTPKEGITAEVYVVSSFDDLKANADKVKGKIVVYDIPYISYGQAVQYRVHGADPAAKFGAVASLVRSSSPIGMNNPHSGSMRYKNPDVKIPHAAITAEDAAMLGRMQKRGQTPRIKLYMEADTLPDALSANIIGEYKTDNPHDTIIVVGGHSDSWDLGTGAHDDASGCLATWKAVKLIKDLGIKLPRTLRAVMFVNEENGVRGGKAYAKAHKDEPHAMMLEMDGGAFLPSRIMVGNKNDSVLAMLQIFNPLLHEIHDSLNVVPGWGGVDIGPMVRQNNIPALGLGTNGEGKYFWYHHGPSDTMDKIDPKVFNQCIAAIAVTIYLYANL